MQVRGKTRWCFSVILAFSKSLHESCRLFAFYRRAAHFFFLQAVYLGLTLSATLYYTVHRYRYLAVRYLNVVLEIPSYQRHIDSGTLGLVPELRKHTQIPVTQAQQGVLGTDSLWVLSLSRTLYRYGTAVRIHTTGIHTSG